MLGLEQKLSLYGFNNLTKTLSFNIYDVCYAKTEREQKEYIAYIDEQYNSERLTKILCDVTEMIGARILNISKQDYEPQGASVNVLIAEKALDEESIDPSCNQGKIGGDVPEMIHAHLDKSHVTVHTFPEYPRQLHIHIPSGYRCFYLRNYFSAKRTELSYQQL